MICSLCQDTEAIYKCKVCEDVFCKVCGIFHSVAMRGLGKDADIVEIKKEIKSEYKPN